MSLASLAILLTIVSNLGYHLCTKQFGGSTNPFVSLGFTYLTAFLLCLVLAPFFGGGNSVREEVLKVSGWSYALGVCIVFLELGFILAYRTGWNISLAALYSNVAVGIVLLPLGIYFFGEKLSSSQLAGIFFSLLGLVLLGR
jgi:drug/metabolite transporter (DMT)-like permease